MTSQHDGRPRGRETSEAAATVARVRQNLGWSIEALSRASGLNEDMLRAIEAGTAAPSLRALWTLARVFEIPFGTLLLGSRIGESSFAVLRKEDAPVVCSGGGFRSRSLLVTHDPQEPEVYEITLAPAWVESAAPHAHGTFEHLTVRSGTLVVVTETERAELNAGDALFFRADRPHRYENHGTEEAVAYLTMTYAGDWLPPEPHDDEDW